VAEKCEEQEKMLEGIYRKEEWRMRKKERESYPLERSNE